MNLLLRIVMSVCLLCISLHNKQIKGRVISVEEHLLSILDQKYDQRKIQKWKIISGRKRSFLTFIQIPSGQKFLVKQFKSDCVKAQFGAVREALSAYVGQLGKIPVNRVNIIPRDMVFPGKIFDKKPATVHSFLQGSKPHSFKKFERIDLKQWWRAHVDIAERGMRLSLIKDMSLHKDLPVIIAFDTFVCNTDRNPTNIFYDSTSDSFFGFDLENSWRRPYDYLLSEIACHNFYEILHDNSITLSSSQVKGLKIYNDTLKDLFEKVPLKKIHQKMHELTIQAGFVQGRVINRRKMPIDVEKYIQYYKDRIAKHYECTKEVVVLVDGIINKHTNKLKDKKSENF